MSGSISILTTDRSIPTIEIDLASVNPQYGNHRSMAASILQVVGEKAPGSHITIYSYFTRSFNFLGRETDSVFFGFAGASDLILAKMLDGFKSVPGIEARFSDYIPAREDLLDLHLENGTVFARTEDDSWEIVA